MVGKKVQKLYLHPLFCFFFHLVYSGMTMKEASENIIQSVENRIEEFDTNPEIIENFDLLKRTGILDHISRLNVEIHNLEDNRQDHY